MSHRAGPVLLTRVLSRYSFSRLRESLIENKTLEGVSLKSKTKLESASFRSSAWAVSSARSGQLALASTRHWDSGIKNQELGSTNLVGIGDSDSEPRMKVGPGPLTFCVDSGTRSSIRKYQGASGFKIGDGGVPGPSVI